MEVNSLLAFIWLLFISFSSRPIFVLKQKNQSTNFKRFVNKTFQFAIGILKHLINSKIFPVLVFLGCRKQRKYVFFVRKYISDQIEIYRLEKVTSIREIEYSEYHGQYYIINKVQQQINVDREQFNHQLQDKLFK